MSNEDRLYIENLTELDTYSIDGLIKEYGVEEEVIEFIEDNFEYSFKISDYDYRIPYDITWEYFSDIVSECNMLSGKSLYEAEGIVEDVRNNCELVSKEYTQANINFKYNITYVINDYNFDCVVYSVPEAVKYLIDSYNLLDEFKELILGGQADEN